MKVLVLGGGISGLLAAWYHHRRGDAVEVWEARDQVGGWVQTLPWPGPQGQPGSLERGPQGILVSPGAPADQLFRELDLPLRSPGQGARWVGKEGRLVKVPPHPLALMISPLMSWKTKLRMCMEPFLPVGPSEPEESLEAFIARRAGQGLARELLPAMVAGILAAPPSLLSVDAIPRLRQWESHGSLFQGIRKGGVSHLMVPQGGMGALPQRLAERLPCVQVHLRAQALEPLEKGRWRAVGEGRRIEADRLILALPSFEAAALLRPIASSAAEALEAIPYTSVQLWHSRHTPLAPYQNGFGFLIHPIPENPYLGTLVPSWICPASAPEGLMQLRSFIGDSQLWGGQPGGQTWPWTLTQLQHWLPALADPAQIREERAPQAIPRPELGHRKRIDSLKASLPPGLEWVSNARFGPGVRDVIEGLANCYGEA